MKKQLLAASALCLGLTSTAETIDVKSVRYAGPYTIQQPYKIDEKDVNSKVFTLNSLLDTPLTVDVIQNGSLFTGNALPGTEQGQALHLIGFAAENRQYTPVKLQINGLQNYHCYVDGNKQTAGELTLEPGTHEFIIKYLSEAGVDNTLQISLETPKDNVLTLREDGKRMYTLSAVLHNRRYNSAQLSPDGKFLMVSYRINQKDGNSESFTRITELANGRIVAERKEHLQWMPSSSRYYYTRTGVNSRELVAVNPQNGQEEILAGRLPEGSFQMAPTENYLIYTLTQEGPAEKTEIYEIIEPDDRQPGWRNRSYLAKYDLKSGLMQPLTYGYHNVSLTDISPDGQHILMMSSESRLTQRPTTLYTLYRLNTRTMETEKLVEKDGFIADAGFSPDGRQIYITGSPEALNGIGKNVQDGQIPSMYDYQLYLMNLEDHKITPVTKNFNPNVMQVEWNRADGMLYFTAGNRDCISLYRLNTTTGDIRQLETKEDLVNSISLASNNTVMAYYGQGASNSDRLYMLDLRKQKTTLVEDLSAETLKNVELGECRTWNFTNTKGDTIYGRYYLPPHFDTSRKYPMIVNYYGGCSPVERSFESRYPHHAYAALGYIVYVIEPSGATGFGQEFSARHVNTAGEGPAQDIIEGTQQFCQEHPFVNAGKIGCIGASYGGFMTQYLQTKTNLFAAAISHAGISDHTSYWGEGYWGYSYSEVSMAGSYPWKDKELYINRSPLFNADKIQTPLLFLHGDSDKNVPVGESIQMYTALKLLGKETAMVLVNGQDHHIVDYDKRILWEHTIYAWFAKWLQDDATWWNALYKPKSL